jgi:hypothetical protein
MWNELHEINDFISSKIIFLLGRHSTTWATHPSRFVLFLRKGLTLHQSWTGQESYSCHVAGMTGAYPLHVAIGWDRDPKPLSLYFILFIYLLLLLLFCCGLAFNHDCSNLHLLGSRIIGVSHGALLPH